MNDTNLVVLGVFVSLWLNYNCHKSSKGQRIHKVYELIRLNNKKFNYS